jgi:hemolysin activation/secretion protein
VQSYAGVGSYARSFAQFTPHFELYKSFDAASNFVLAEKLGGGITVGKTTYYQSMFLGGEEHMIGYKENRFAGQHMFYNNLETRIKLSGLLPYILPGQFGVTGFYDIGRVWIRQEKSATWHNGFGAGAYFSPADMALVHVKAGYSKEGWYPYANLTFTF